MADAPRKLIAENRKARHDFHILERVEAGLALTGTEVKSLRDGGGNIREAYAVAAAASCSDGANIAPYKQGNSQNHDPLRDRKLLFHRRRSRSSQAGWPSAATRWCRCRCTSPTDG